MKKYVWVAGVLVSSFANGAEGDGQLLDVGLHPSAGIQKKTTSPMPLQFVGPELRYGSFDVGGERLVFIYSSAGYLGIGGNKVPLESLDQDGILEKLRQAMPNYALSDNILASAMDYSEVTPLHHKNLLSYFE